MSDPMPTRSSSNDLLSGSFIPHDPPHHDAPSYDHSTLSVAAEDNRQQEEDEDTVSAAIDVRDVSSSSMLTFVPMLLSLALQNLFC